MEIEYKRLNNIEVKELLQKASKDFTPPLCQTIDIQEYSEKLSKNANFAYIKDGNDVIAFIAYYLNFNEQFVYIPFVWVSSEYTRRHFAQKLLQAINYQAKIHSYSYSALEVRIDNVAAYSFYTKHGYKVIECRGEKLYLKKIL